MRSSPKFEALLARPFESYTQVDLKELHYLAIVEHDIYKTELNKALEELTGLKAHNADLEQSLGEHQTDQCDAAKQSAARMREIDALVAGGRLLDRERLTDAFTARYRTSKERSCAGDGADLAQETVKALVAGLLSEQALLQFEFAFVSTSDEGKLDDIQAGIRAALREVLGGEVADRTQSCPRCDMHAEEAKAEKARADKAEAERDALRAEVEALRGLPESDAAIKSILAHRYDYSNAVNAMAGLRAALATVPRAKVGEAVKPTEHHALCNCDGCLAKTSQPRTPRLATDAEVEASGAPSNVRDVLIPGVVTSSKEALAWLIRAVVAMQHDRDGTLRPDAARLAPLPVPDTPEGFLYRKLIIRINELSAIVSRGTL